MPGDVWKGDLGKERLFFFFITLPCLYFETYHTCTKNPNKRNGKQTANGKRALMGKTGCGSA